MRQGSPRQGDVVILARVDGERAVIMGDGNAILSDVLEYVLEIILSSERVLRTKIALAEPKRYART